jgi:very-short-patch-repair endonuclease
MGRIDLVLARVAARRHGLITLDDVIRAGGDLRLVHRRLTRGRWIAADRCVYRMAGAPVTWHARLAAAVLAAGEGAAASHHSAAVLWESEGFRPGVPELTIPRGRKYRRSGIRTHESTDLDRCTVEQRAGIAVTDPARTLLDLARYTSDRSLLRSVERARRQRLVTWTSLVATLARHARRGRPDIRRLRRVIVANAHREEVTDSDFELLVLVLLVEAGLPEPVLQHPVTIGGRAYRIDLAYPELGVAIELDGRQHLDEEVRERDLPRQDSIILDDWVVLRYTWDYFRSRPELIVSEVRAALRSARSRRRLTAS